MSFAADVIYKFIKVPADVEGKKFEVALFSSEQRFISRLLPKGYSLESVAKLSKLKPVKKVGLNLQRSSLSSSTWMKNHFETILGKDYLDQRKPETSVQSLQSLLEQNLRNQMIFTKNAK